MVPQPILPISDTRPTPALDHILEVIFLLMEHSELISLAGQRMFSHSHMMEQD